MINSNYPKTVIIGNGEFPTHEIPLQILHNATTIICCDGAADELHKNGITPTVIIGDLDSISSELKQSYKDICIQLSDQDTNDQTKAINWAIENGFSEVVLLGTTGKREDHTIGNIALLGEYISKILVSSVTDYGIFTPIKSSSTLPSYKGQQISIFSLNTNTKISSTLLKYPLQNLQLQSWWMGTLNEALSDSFTLQFESGLLIIYRAF